MVLQKRLDYGFNGYQVPTAPRAARSARRRSAFKNKGEDNQISPFDLLAAVAGKLLLEGRNSSSSSNTLGNGDQCAISQSNVKQEPLDEDQTAMEETCSHDKIQRGFFISEILPETHQMQSFKGSLSPPKDSHFGSTSVITTSDSSEGLGTRELVNGEAKNETGSLAGDCNRSEHNDKESRVGGLNDERKLTGNVVPKDEHPHIGSGYKKSAYENSIPQNFLPGSPDDVDLVGWENGDDENFSAHAHISNAAKPFRSTPPIGDRRIRKILASKQWTVSSKPKDTTISNSDVDLKPGYCSRKTYHRSLRFDRNYPIKKRRYFDCFTVSKSDEGVNNEGLSGSPRKASAVSSSIAGHNTTSRSGDSHVKLRIKSFRVPELFIEIPETATVGSLKRAVLEAVTAILGGGLRIGVLVQGKKVRDDNKTLLQTGISQDSLSDALGFCLEPNPLQSPKPLCPEHSNFLIPCNVPQPLIRNLPLPANHNVLAMSSNLIESDHDSTPSPPKPTADKSAIEYSRALAPVTPLHAEAVTVIPPRKSKRSEVAKRRIRRPFSVAEVEALVQAVEKLGTGRWRDVKLQAFDSAKHRTYVDLKDKWKTLVHTARISPQQRRGEPVPQELLDRVLTAHAYWSQQQGKHQPQQQRQRPETRLGL